MPHLPCVQRGCQKPGEESKWRSIVFRTPRSVVFFVNVGRDSWDWAVRGLVENKKDPKALVFVGGWGFDGWSEFVPQEEYEHSRRYKSKMLLYS